MGVRSIGTGSLVNDLLDTSSITEEEELEDLEEKLKEAYAEKQKEYVESLKTGTSSSGTAAYTALSDSAESVGDAFDAIRQAVGRSDAAAIEEAVTGFVSSYNAMLSGLKTVSGAECNAMLKQFAAYAEEHKEELSAIGISVASSGKLSVDAEALATADPEAVEALFGSGAGFASKVRKVSDSAVSVASLKTSGYNALQLLYGNSGTLNKKNMTASILDAFS